MSWAASLVSGQSVDEFGARRRALFCSSHQPKPTTRPVTSPAGPLTDDAKDATPYGP